MPAIPIEDVLFLDAETRSALDLRKVGSWRYLRSATTDVFMVCWTIGNDPIQTWYPGDPVPPAVIEHVQRGGYVSAHNIGFEFPLIELILAPRYGWPRVPIAQLHDTAAECAAMALPRALEDAGQVLGLAVQKDIEGHSLMLRMCRPRKTLYGACPICEGAGCGVCDGTGNDFIWWDDPERIKRLEAYCKIDVVVARDVFRRTRRLPPDERRVWEMDQEINQSGIKVDLELVRALQAVVEQTKLDLDAQMAKVTGGAVKKCSNAKAIVTWLRSIGVQTDSIAKPAVTAMLLDRRVPEVARQALMLRRTAAKSSTAKLKTMIAAASPDDGRLRGMFRYHGAATGRWAGSLVQLHNLIRKSPPGDLDLAVEVVKAFGYDGILLMYGDPMGFSSAMLRPCLVPDEDEELYTADLSQIEARMVAGLAGEQDVLDVFASGQDVYCHAASGIFARPITKKDDQERQVGKVSTLSLGFQGGPVAFAAMAKNYNLDIAAAYEPVMASATEEQIERAGWGWDRYDGPMTHKAFLTSDVIKQAWRLANPNIVQYWRDCEDAVLEAVQTGGTVHVGAVTYQTAPIAGRNFLWTRLPNGRLLCYTDPELRRVRTAWGAEKLAVVASSVDSRTKKWKRRVLYGGLLCENNTQAAARDVLVGGMFRLRDAGYRIGAHVHDEAIVCIRKGAGDREQIRQLMIEREPWVVDLGLPVDADVSPALNRYRK